MDIGDDGDKSLNLHLPWPPSANHYYRRVGNRTLISKPGRIYRQTVVAMVRPRVPVPMTGRVTMTIYAHPPDRRRRDLDNVQKALLDSLQHAGVYVDDSQIDVLCIHRCNVIPSGCIRVQIIEA